MPDTLTLIDHLRAAAQARKDAYKRLEDAVLACRITDDAKADAIEARLSADEAWTKARANMLAWLDEAGE